MRPLALLALALPFGGPTTPPPAAGWTSMDVMGLTLLVGPADTRVGFGGLTATMPVRAAGGEGVATVRQGLSRDISVTLREADAKEVAALFDLPAWLKPKLVGRIGLVRLEVRGDKFDLKASGFRIPADPVKSVAATGDLKAGTVRVVADILGGRIEYEGKIATTRE